MKFTLEDAYDFDFQLLGISCHEKDYRICWAVNQILGISLQKEDKAIEVIIKKTNKYSLHTTFTYFDTDNEIDFRLIANRSTMGHLIPEKKQADYLLMVSNNYEHNVEKTRQLINQIPFVLTSFSIDIETLKSKENLVF